jgi:hypothetical protein
MILGVSNPIENEPGHEIMGAGNTSEAKVYRNQVQCKTVLYAILFWLESVQAKGSIWMAISANSWLHNGRRVLENVKRRSKSNTVLRAYNKNDPNIKTKGGWGRGGRGVDLVARLEKSLGFFGTGKCEGLNKYRY